jgi:XTP/dITP diphosphohydrolase
VAGMALQAAGGDRDHDQRNVTGAAHDHEPDPLREAAEVMRAVRDRCVWTQQIDHRALVPYLVEESAELIDAVEDGTRAELREELGDLLWQVLFHAEIASRDPDDPFDIDDVARGLTDKMVRRHPHVFGDAVATTPEEVLVHWNAAKAAEKSTRTSVLDGVSERMPSLALAQKLVGKAAQVGVDPARVQLVDEGVGGSLPLGDQAYPRESDVRGPVSEADLGDALLALVAAARANGWDAERALRERLRKLEDEIRTAEAPPRP